MEARNRRWAVSALLGLACGAVLWWALPAAAQQMPAPVSSMAGIPLAETTALDITITESAWLSGMVGITPGQIGQINVTQANCCASRCPRCSEGK